MSKAFQKTATYVKQEITDLHVELDRLRTENGELRRKYNEVLAESEYDQRNAAMSQKESSQLLDKVERLERDIKLAELRGMEVIQAVATKWVGEGFIKNDHQQGYLLADISHIVNRRRKELEK